MRCAVNATTEKGPRVALRSVLSAGRCAASCGVPLQIGRRRRRKEIGLLPSFPPCPACFFDGATVDGSFVIVAGSVQFRNGNGMGAWQKGAAKRTAQRSASFSDLFRSENSFPARGRTQIRLANTHTIEARKSFFARTRHDPFRCFTLHGSC